MFKSMQSKMILFMFIFILLIIAICAVFSVFKMEQVYYRGFVNEMLNTISSFGINVNNANDTTLGQKPGFANKIEEENIEKVIDNFNIYFSLNNNTRNGIILDENQKVIYSSNDFKYEDTLLKEFLYSPESNEEYKLINKNEYNQYYFVYYIKEFASQKVKYTLVVEQDKSYINYQMREASIFYIVGLIIISIITIIVTKLLASNVTKPIEYIRKKAQLIAAGSDINEIVLDESQRSEYEVIRLVESFNLMIGQIRNNLNEISSEKNKLEAILLHLSDGVLAFNTQGELIHANPAAKKMLNIEDETNFDNIFSKYNIDVNMEKIMYLDEWTTTETKINIEDLIVNIFFASFKNEQDNLGGLVAVVHDITKQAKLDDMRREFVSDVSHELKTPLTSIKGYTETILADMEPTEDGEEVPIDREEEKRFLNVILSESNRMNKLVLDLLELSKIDSNKKVWKKIYFDLPELTKQVVEKHEIQAEAKKQEVECYITSNVPMCYADRDGIEQVITNVLSNAIKYTPENGSIKVYVGSVHDDAYIKVIDNGIGIPEEDLTRVFERFYRVDKARSREMGGTGLGLPISKEIIERNGGSIDMKSEVGKGTEVIIKVPLKEEESLN